MGANEGMSARVIMWADVQRGWASITRDLPIRVYGTPMMRYCHGLAVADGARCLRAVDVLRAFESSDLFFRAFLL